MSLSKLLILKTVKIFKQYYQSIVVMWQHTARYDTTENRNSDLAVCGAVPQPTVSSSAP